MEAFLATIQGAIMTSAPIAGTDIVVPVFFEYLAVVFGGVSGAMYACDRRFDIVGAMILSVACGLGGGIIRDIFLQTHGIYAFQEPMMIVACFASSIVVFYFRGIFKHLTATMFFVDAMTVGLFAFLGADKSLQAGLTILPAILLGTITAVGGGMMRDLLCSEVPTLFQQGNFYGIAGIAGSTVYCVLALCHFTKVFSGVLCLIVVLLIRYLSVIYDWHTSEPKDFTPQIKRSAKAFFEQLFERSGNRAAHRQALYATGKFDRIPIVDEHERYPEDYLSEQYLSKDYDPSAYDSENYDYQDFLAKDYDPYTYVPPDYDPSEFDADAFTPEEPETGETPAVPTDTKSIDANTPTMEQSADNEELPPRQTFHHYRDWRTYEEERRKRQEPHIDTRRIPDDKPKERLNRRQGKDIDKR